MLLFGVCLVCLSYVHTYIGTLVLFCIICTGHGAYQSSVIINPSDILPDHSGLAFGMYFLICILYVANNCLSSYMPYMHRHPSTCILHAYCTGVL